MDSTLSPVGGWQSHVKIETIDAALRRLYRKCLGLVALMGLPKRLTLQKFGPVRAPGGMPLSHQCERKVKHG